MKISMQAGCSASITSARTDLRVRKSLRCEIVRERDFRLISRELVDISRTGARLITHEAILTGEELVLSFSDDRGRVFVDAEAEVVRVVHGRRPNDRLERTRGARTLGIRFSALPGESAKHLESMLGSLAVAAARRNEALRLTGAPREPAERSGARTRSRVSF
jgi:c-di-GMP-binding flagellar brake protein YcgR